MAQRGAPAPLETGFSMSIAVMNHVWNNSPQAGGSLVLLLKLADWANDEGICYPSMAKLAKKSRMSERQARRIVRLLVAAGEISIEQVGGRIEGRNLANVYRVKTDGGVKMSSPDARVPAGGTFPVAWGGSGRPPIRKEPSKETRGSRRGSFSFGESEQGISDRLAEIRAEIRDLMHPGGCAQAVLPTRLEKLDRLRELEAARDLLKQMLAKKRAAA